MMNPLLKRQVRKYLSEQNLDKKEWLQFLEAIDQSYNNYEEQLKMSQRAMRISSDELFDANVKLREEAQKQKKVIDRLNHLVHSLAIDTTQPSQQNMADVDLYGFFERQSEEILKIDRQKKELMKDLERKNQALSDYAHIVSHDLKSPLRSIDSLVNWIMEDNKDQISASCGEEFGLILKNLERMDGLINGILNYSTIDQSNMESYKVDTQNLVNDIVQVLFVPNHIQIKVQENLPVIQGNEFRLQQLFQNIIQNAIKSIDKDTGKIEIGVQEMDNVWKFYVGDNGKGIPERHYKKIFQIFEKLENNLSTGIGLSIVKKIIDFYQGEIWLDSEEGKGTTFYFTIPKQ